MSKVWSGERLETFIFNENTTEHLHRYALACSICKNLDVLDIASGEGYGSNLLSVVARNVIGVDISKEAVDESVKKYKKNNLSFREGSASKIPIPDNSIDVVVSFETIEHHDMHLEMMNEIKRVLRPKGVLIMSSPDKKYYTDLRKYTNPFHIKELYFEEFKSLINANFSCTKFLFQRIVSGSLIVHEDSSVGFSEYEGNYEKISNEEKFTPLYNICIASNDELPGIPSSLFDGDQVNSIATNMLISKAVEDSVKAHRNTWSYKIGHILLSPLRIFKRA